MGHLELGRGAAALAAPPQPAEGGRIPKLARQADLSPGLQNIIGYRLKTTQRKFCDGGNGGAGLGENRGQILLLPQALVPRPGGGVRIIHCQF